MRALIAASLLVFAAPAFAEELEGAATPETRADWVSAGYQPDIYRYGGTFAVKAADDAPACAKLCEANADCVTWSFVTKTNLADARCELKVSMGRSEKRPGAYSGFSSKAFGGARMSFAAAPEAEKPSEAAPAKIAEVEAETVEAAAPVETAATAEPVSLVKPVAPEKIAATAPSLKPDPFQSLAPVEVAESPLPFSEALALEFKTAEIE